MNELEFKLGNQEKITDYHLPFSSLFFFFFFFFSFFLIHIYMLLILTTFPVSYLILIIQFWVKG